MPSLSPIEVVTVLAIALIVFGPQKLPELARTIGKTLGDLRRMAADVRTEFETGLDDEDEDEPLEDAHPTPLDPDEVEN
ncbi:MAG TPA: twin-arginine translocase TatA/TatE family subunit [Actinomycetota bacterium]|nr:twin-arginine translocase TatA/TatE family subunit [Actinomycetota bacterium]